MNKTTALGLAAFLTLAAGCGDFSRQDVCLPNANDCAVPFYDKNNPAPTDLPFGNGPNPGYVDCNAFREEYDNGTPKNANACKPKNGAHAGRIGGVESSKVPVVINEVLVDPEGPNAGNQSIELWNVGKPDFDLSGFIIDCDAGRAELPAGTILPTASFLTIHVGSAGLDRLGEVFLADLGTLNDHQGYVAFITPGGIIADYVQWGGGGQALEQFAAREGQWTPREYCLPPAEGYSLIFAGVGNSSRDFAAARPTLGKPN